MGQKSTQERTKNRSTFETNFKRLPGAILVEHDVQLGRKYGPKRDQKTTPKQDSDFLAKCLILGSVLGPKLDQKSIKSGYRKSIEIWTTTKS